MPEQYGNRLDRCDACRYWHPHPGRTRLGQCRIKPPVSSAGGLAAWPEVEAGAWCGQFQPRNTIAAGFIESISDGLHNFVTEIKEIRQAAQRATARPVAEDTQKLFQLLDIFIKGWETSSDQIRQQVRQKLHEIAEEFILEDGAWKSDNAVREFLFDARSPKPPPDQQAAINFLQLLEGAHGILSQSKSLPESHRVRFEELLIVAMSEFQDIAYPLSVPYPFDQRWTWLSS